jgi:hypothetical protein
LKVQVDLQNGIIDDDQMEPLFSCLNSCLAAASLSINGKIILYQFPQTFPHLPAQGVNHAQIDAMPLLWIVAG